MQFRQKEQYVQRLMLESNEHSWNTMEFRTTGGKDVSSGVARAVAGEEGGAGSRLPPIKAP